MDFETNTDARSYRVCFDKIERVLGFRQAKTLHDGVTEIDTALSQGLVRNPASPAYHNHKLLSFPGRELNKQFSVLRAIQGTVGANDAAAGA